MADYSIQVEVERRTKHLAAAKAVAAAYPDAQVCWLDEKRCVFVSPSVKPTRVCDFVHSRSSFGDPSVVLAAYAVVLVDDGETVSVFLGNRFGELARAYLSDSNLTDEARAALISLVKP